MADIATEPAKQRTLAQVRRDAGGFESSASVARRLASEPVSVRALMLRFVLAGVVALILVAVVTAFASVSVGTDLAINDAQRTTWVTAVGIIEPVIDEGLLELDRDSLQRVDSAVRTQVLQGALVRVKIWDDTGRIVYSDESRLIGQQFALDEHELAMFTPEEADTRPEAEISDLTKPENVYETETKLLEVYLPVHTPQGTIMLYETYFRYEAVTDVGRDLWRRFAPLAIGGLLVLEIVQIPFAWRLARRLRTGQQHRELLLRHAIDASEAERRRIAGNLHDGVVQELTGISLSLAASARNRPDADPRLAEASSAIRESVKSLRSLLVEIYPPNLHEEGLESALGDLLGRLTNRGMTATLTVDPKAARLGPDATALLYRVAQEALRNVAAHSEASHVSLTVEVTKQSTALSIVDDGRGFDVGRLGSQQRDGHVGLRSLAGLIEDSGGELSVRSSPGAGTHLQVTLTARKATS